MELKFNQIKDISDAAIIVLTTKVNMLEGKLKNKGNQKEHSGSPGTSNGKGKTSMNPETPKKNNGPP
eukprot:2876900-Ditylum_brightwellii.AAC.1